MTTLKELTKKQREVLRFIFEKITKDKCPPTIREIAEHFGFSSTGTVRDYLKVLVNKGFIKVSASKSRAIELVKEALFQVPILGKVQAGNPTLAVEDIEGYLNFENLMFSEDETFALRVRGESMIGAGIMPDDLVLVRKQNIAQTGETIVALVGEDATVKKLQKRGSDYFLDPANERFEPIKVNEDVLIIGKVVSVVRKM